MALDQHWKDMYSDSVTELGGFQFRNRLSQHMKHDTVGGEHAWFDSYAPLDEATDVLVVDDSGEYRMEFEEAGSTTFTAWFDLQTPHTQIAKDRTLCPARRIEAGYTFRELDDVCENASPQSRVLQAIMRRIARAEDSNTLNVLTALTATRGKDLVDAVAVPFPTTQVLSITAGIAAFDKDVVATISQKFEENYLDGQMIYQIITPAMKASLIINSGDVIQSSDFIDHGHHKMERYELPEVYGVHMIVHQLMSEYDVSVLGTHAEGISVAFTEDWGYINSFKPLQTQIEEAPTQRFSYILYIREFVNAVRIDDTQVVIVGFGTVT